MKQFIHLITLGVKDLAVSKKFYVDGFGWKIKSEDNDTILYQMHGLILSTWLNSALENDTQISLLKGHHNSSLAYFVEEEREVNDLILSLTAAGGYLIRQSGKPTHGGLRGYISDPDKHIWEIICNNDFLLSNCTTNCER